MFFQTQKLLRIFQLALLSLFFYFFARLEFLIWNWSQYKGKPVWDLLTSFLVGMRFDISAVLMLMSPLLLFTLVPWGRSWDRFYRRILWAGFVVLQSVFLTFNLVDTEFINFVGRRFSYDALFIMNEVGGKLGNFFVSYWFLFSANTCLVILLCAGAYWLIFKYEFKNSKYVATAKEWLGHTFLAFVSLIVFVIGIRGGLQTKPLSFVNANIFAAPVLNNLVLNSTFTFVKSFKEDGVNKNIFFQDKKEMLSLLNGSIETPSALEGLRPNHPQNVMIIIFESFGAEYFGPHQGKSYTPFLDELAEKSLNFKNAYANGRRSIEGVAAIMAGVPAMMNEPFISSHFMSNYFVGLGSILAEQKYHTSFFHGAKNGSMYFDSFMQSAGVEHYFGASEYPNSKDHDGVWGIWDHAFLPFMSEKIKSFSKPMLTSVFTLTSHQPYKIPAQFEKQFPEGPIPVLKCIAYTDDQLRQFFASIEKEPWYKDTLFIITGDHTATHYLKEAEGDRGDYRVPLLFYHPSYKWPKTVDTEQVVQQIDILPSVLDFLGLPQKDKNFLGSSVFVSGDKVSVQFIDGHYILFGHDYYLKWLRGAEKPLMYSQADTLASKPLDVPTDRRVLLENKLKAAIQYFGEGMWDNKLYYPAKGL